MIIRPLLFYQTAEHSACVTLIIHLQSSILIPYSSGTESMPTARWCPIKWHKAAGLQDKGTFTHYIENLQACLCYYWTPNFLCWQPRQASSCASAHLYLIPLLWQRPLFFFSLFIYLLKSESSVGVFSFPPLFPSSQISKKQKKNIRVISNGTESPSSPLYASSRVNCGQIFFFFFFFVKLNQSSLSVAVLERMAGAMEETVIVVRADGSARMSPASAWQWFKKKKQRKKKVRPWSIPALCSLHFLLLNFHQPPHNNMADPACGTGATQLELQTEIRLLQLVWDQPRQEMMTEGERK